MTTAVVRCACDSRTALHEAGEEAARQAIQGAVRTTRTVALESILIEKDALGKPFGRLAGKRSVVALSISHSFPYALATATERDGHALGADIEHIREFATATWEAFLTPAEKKNIARAPAHEHAYLRTLSWSLKESVLKACGVGIRVHPRHVDISNVLREQALPSHRIEIKGISYVAWVRSWRVDHEFIATTIALPVFPSIINTVRPYGTTYQGHRDHSGDTSRAAGGGARR